MTSLPRFCRSLLLVGIAAFASSACGQAGPILSGDFNTADVPIYESRIFRVPDENQAQALDLLGEKDFTALSPVSLKALFPKTKFDEGQMLSAQSSAADAYAKRRESEAADPFFASSREWMLHDAKAHRDFARYTRTLPRPLHPYLVKAEAYFEGTGGFFVSLKGNKLSVFHGSLGHSTPPIHKVAVVILLEREINTVTVSTSIAE